MRWDDRLDALPAAERNLLLERRATDAPGVQAAVADILADVRARGDAALLELARRLDGARLDAIEVPRERCRAALDGLPADVRRALERARANIERFHRALLPSDVVVEVEPGVSLTRRWAPLARVGVYAPGGRAAYPSSVLMGVVPARAAGVGEVFVCSPPGPEGAPPAA
ncbi:MAG: histidinol dehydrogenase, partial [Gemmatimonadetes bacterium]